jgi:transcription termination factor Rho
MSVLDRASLEQSPLADLHVIASELSLDGYRRLRKEELIKAILDRQEGGESSDNAEPGDAASDEEQPSPRRRRGRRGGRGRGRGNTVEDGQEEEEEAAAGDAVDEEPATPEGRDEEVAEGVVELLPNGSAFLRVDPPDPSDEDIYVSAAQVRRCELVSGDRVAGPRRAPRRSERFASLVRVDTINGRPATEVADSTRFEDLAAGFPSERLPLDSDDLTITAIAELAPIGRGSRVAIVGAAQSGKSELLRRLAQALAGHEDLQLWLVLAGVRPEEAWEWRHGPVAPNAVVTLAASPEAQGQAVEGVIEQARRLTARGAHSVVLIDTLESVHPPAARRALGSARKLIDGGTLTVIATAPAPVGGETTVITLDAALARVGQFPAVDPAGTWTMRRELLR